MAFIYISWAVGRLAHFLYGGYMVVDTTKEHRVFYNLLQEDAKEYEEPQLAEIYKWATRDLHQVISKESLLHGTAGDRLIRMGNIEAIKEMQMLNRIFGVNLNIQLKNRNDVRQLTEAINTAFHFKAIAERNANMIKSPDFRSGIKAVFSYFPGYFLQALKQEEPHILKEINKMWVNNKRLPIGDAGKIVFEQHLSKLIYQATVLMLEKAKVEQSTDNKYQNAYQEILDAIRTDFLQTGNNIFLERLADIYKLNKVAEDFQNILNLQSSFNLGNAFQEIEKNLSAGRQLGSRGGFTFEGLIDQALSMTATEINGTKTADGSVISANYSKGFGSLDARPDNVMYFNIPESTINNTVEQINKNRRNFTQSRLTDADAIMQLMDNIKNINDGYIVYFNDKNYNIGKSSTAHKAASNVKLKDLDSILANASIDVNQLIYNILQATSGGISEGNDYGAADAIAQEVAFFLFDDWNTIGAAQSGGNAIHIMSLEGIMIPLSAFLFAMGTAINSAKAHVDSFARATITFTEISFGKGVKDTSGRGARFIKDNWDVQQTDAFANTTITVEFLQSMQEFVRSYVKG